MTANNPVRRNILLLALCQALFMTSTSAIIASAPIIGGILLTTDKVLVTLPLALQFVAMALTTIPASLYMERVGRRVGFMTGAGIAIVGALVGVHAIMVGSFALFCLATALVGSFNGFCHFLRFAAADTASVEFRSRAISYVLAGSVIAAVLGPTLARNSVDILPAQFAGVFAALIAVYVAVGIVVSFIDIPRPARRRKGDSGRPLLVIARQPKFLIAVCAATFGYLVMSFLMTVTPIAMGVCGFTFSDSSYVIQAHVVGMYLPAFITGHLIKWFGVNNVLLAGAVLCLGSIAVSLSGIEFVNFLVAMVFVGVGWNFLFTGGTALVTETYTPEEQAKVQGFNDFVIWGTVSVGVVASGMVQQTVGWTAVNVAMVPLVVIVLAATLWMRFRSDGMGGERAAT